MLVTVHYRERHHFYPGHYTVLFTKEMNLSNKSNLYDIMHSINGWTKKRGAMLIGWHVRTRIR